MKKIKWTLLTVAILFSVVGAFATRPAAFQGLYYNTGSGYAPAGILGVNYVCETSSDVCTYTKSGNTYLPYQLSSTYIKLGVTTPTTQPAPKKDK